MPRTLVLNLDEQPLNIISHYAAFIDVWAGKATVVEYYQDLVILLGEGRQARAPAIIKINYYALATPHMNPAALTKQNVYKRDNYTCAYTGKRLGNDDLSWDHVIPTSKGGTHTWENLVTCHRKINELKGNFILGVDPEVSKLPIPKPFRPHNLLLMQKGDILPCWIKYLQIVKKVK